MHDSTTDISLDLLGAHREPITGPIGDYKSHAFTTSIAINPLIAAAMPLLALASEIEQLESITNHQQFLESLIHEVKAFENSASQNGYRSQQILAARYILCAVIDEKVTTYQRNTPWNNNLLQTFQHEAWGGERFFIIIERAYEEANSYIDYLNSRIYA
ncbi:MAG: hypothetical protein COB66_01045 [Coxiella sp. (in: Bacteria)]|nr:MAG: hypothetical protein COB66_01045 [Coxiella sp. (in: g-proteobacteria)]